MTDKQYLVAYLNRYQKALAKIAEMEHIRQRIEASAVSPKGVNIDAVKVKSNKLSDRVSQPVVSAVSIGEKIEQLRSKLPALAESTTRIINMLPSDNYRGQILLEMRFVFGYPLSTACSILHVSRSQVYLLYGKALEALLDLQDVHETLERYKIRLKENKLRWQEKEHCSGKDPRE